jgi:hypothetical protein
MEGIRPDLGKYDQDKVARFLFKIKCLKMFPGWDHYTFESQPPFFMANLLNYLDAQASYQEKHGDSN